MYRILMMRIIQNSSDGRWFWYGNEYLPALSRFFEFWLEWKLGVDACIRTAVFPATLPLTDDVIEVLKKSQQRMFDYYCFIVDRPYPEGSDNDGFYTGTFQTATFTSGGPDWAPYLNDSIRLSHEFLHHFLRLQNRVDRVHDYDVFGGEHDVWRLGREGEAEYVKTGVSQPPETQFRTVGGVYPERVEV